jgi:hypothetical protein
MTDKYGCSNCNGDGCDECRASYPMWTTDGVEIDAPPCAWWLNCTNPADTVEPHPVLGEVPICHRCEQKLRRLEVATER